MKSLFDTLNIVYCEQEKRGFLKLNAMSLSFTAAGIAFVLAALGAVVVVPLLQYRWPVERSRTPGPDWALAGALLSSSRSLSPASTASGPSRQRHAGRWITWGSTGATVLWLVASALFSWYAANFGTFNQTYGSLGAVIGFMTWLLDLSDRDPARMRT